MTRDEWLHEVESMQELQTTIPIVYVGENCVLVGISINEWRFANENMPAIVRFNLAMKEDGAKL